MHTQAIEGRKSVVFLIIMSSFAVLLFYAVHDLNGCGDFAGEMNFRDGVAETSWQTVHGPMARRSHFLLVAAFQQLSPMTVCVQ